MADFHPQLTGRFWVRTDTQQLKEFLEKGKKIIISTVQTFPFVLDKLGAEHRGGSACDFRRIPGRQVVSGVEPIHLLTDAVIPEQVPSDGLLEQLFEPLEGLLLLQGGFL